MNSFKVILATLVIFGAGVVTGGLLVAYSGNVLRHPHKQAALAETQRPLQQKPNANPAPREIKIPLPPNALLRKDFLERLDHELKLRPDQHERIEKIVGEGQDRIKVCCEKIEPEVHAELAATREKIRAELTPEQQALFTDLLKRRFNPPRTNNPPTSVVATNSHSDITPKK